MTEKRVLKGTVVGTAPIDTITVVKNDEIVYEERLRDNDARLGRSEEFQLSFHSDSTPFQPLDNPRGWRTWQGVLQVTGAVLVEASSRDFYPREAQHMRRDAEDGNTYHFTTFTRGAASSLHLTLEEIGRNAKIDLRLAPATEFGGAPQIYRRHQATPAADLTLRLRDAANAPLKRAVASNDYTDEVTLRRVRSDGSWYVPFEYEDRSNRQGDYYYVRVIQANDAIAWSSPIWVGGHRRQ